MSPRAWLAFCGIILFLGIISGWTARTVTADHRYIRALAERHEAEGSYFQARYDETIHENHSDISKERKRNGN